MRYKLPHLFGNLIAQAPSLWWGRTTTWPSRATRATIAAKGYEVTYSEPVGGHESVTWRGTLAQALASMLPKA